MHSGVSGRDPVGDYRAHFSVSESREPVTRSCLNCRCYYQIGRWRWNQLEIFCRMLHDFQIFTTEVVGRFFPASTKEFLLQQVAMGWGIWRKYNSPRLDYDHTIIRFQIFRFHFFRYWKRVACWTTAIFLRNKIQRPEQKLTVQIFIWPSNTLKKRSINNFKADWILSNANACYNFSLHKSNTIQCNIMFD